MEPSMRMGAMGVFKDNEEDIKVAMNKHASHRIKHTDVKHHLVRHACVAKNVGE